MPLWLILLGVGLGAYVVGRAANVIPGLPGAQIISYTVASGGADYYTDLGSSSVAGQPNISTTVSGTIPAGTLITALDSAQVYVQTNTSSSGQQFQQQGGYQSGTMTIIPVVKATYNGATVWINRNELY
jgi:hypothetical protein